MAGSDVTKPPSGQVPSAKKARLPMPKVDSARLAPFLKFDDYPTGGRIPNAALIYGVGAAILFAYSVFFLIVGPRFTGVLLWLPAGALLGYALHFMKYNRDE
jgi:hypothetical protein